MNKNTIHKTALISQKSKIGKNVLIGPYCIIEDNVIIDDNTQIDSHTIIKQYSTKNTKNISFKYQQYSTFTRKRNHAMAARRSPRPICSTNRNNILWIL